MIRFAMCALMPATDDIPGVADTGIDKFLEQIRRESSFMFRLGMVAGALVFMLTPLITVGIPLPAFLLGPSALQRHTSKLTSHPWYLVRQAVFILKMVAGLCWGSHPEVRKRLNLPPYPEDPGTWRAA